MTWVSGFTTATLIWAVVGFWWCDKTLKHLAQLRKMIDDQREGRWS